MGYTPSYMEYPHLIMYGLYMVYEQRTKWDAHPIVASRLDEVH